MSSINIKFPFENSDDGKYISMSETTKDALRSDLLHLILTEKGSRFYLPDFGTNLRQFLFEPNDSKTLSDITNEINDTLSKYLPKLKIDSLTVSENKENVKRADISIQYTVTDGLFSESDNLLVIM